jgi:hypothetical protein
MFRLTTYSPGSFTFRQDCSAEFPYGRGKATHEGKLGILTGEKIAEEKDGDQQSTVTRNTRCQEWTRLLRTAGCFT